MGALLNRRRYMGGGGGTPLPYDSEIEYLESTGTQHIQTGIYPNTNLAYTIKLKRTSASSKDQIAFGSRNVSSYDFSVFSNTSSGKGYAFHYCYGSGGNQREDSGWVYKGDIITDYHTIDVNNQSVSVDGTTCYTWSKHASSLVTSTTQLCLFAMNGGSGTDTRRFVGRIAYIKIYLSDVLVMDCIPVRVGQTGYMYDKVSGNLFGNSGTGDFILGPDKN